MKKQLVLLCAVLLLVPCLSAQDISRDVIAGGGFRAGAPELSDSSYVVLVQIEQQSVYVYKDGQQIRQMICSTGKPTLDNATPTGHYTIDQSGQKRGTWFYSNYYQEGAEYWVGFIGGLYLFHSVPMDADHTIIEEELAKLGTPASHGCVRLSLENAKWFYDTIPSGSSLYIRGVTPGEENLPQPPVRTKTNSALWFLHHHQSYYQQHLLSCEAALVRLFLAMAGVNVDEQDVLDQMPKGTNPETSFVCDNIDQGRRAADGSIRWNNYGTHPPVVIQSLEYWLRMNNKTSLYSIEEDQLSDEQLRDLCRNDDRFLGAIVWVVGHPDRWGQNPAVNERGMVLGEHVRYVNPELADNGDFLVWDPEASGDQPRHYASLPTRASFHYRVVVIRSNG